MLILCHSIKSHIFRYIEVFQSSIAELRSAITRSIRYQAMMFPPALKFGVPNSMLIRGPPLDVHSKRFNYLGQFHNSAQNGRHFEGLFLVK